MLLLLCLLVPFCLLIWHDLWVEAEPYNQALPRPTRVRIGSGEIFVQSELAPKPERFSVACVAGRFGREEIAPSYDTSGGFTVFTLAPGEPGPLWVGIATKPRLIELAAPEFNQYLEHDGLGRILADRRNRGIEGVAAVEQYRKCARALLRVGRLQHSDFTISNQMELEIIPVPRSDDFSVGEIIEVSVRLHGEAAPGFVVQAARAGASRVQTVEVNDLGVAHVEIDSPGRWYLRGIHMAEVQGKPHQYESLWASTTFEVS